MNANSKNGTYLDAQATLDFGDTAAGAATDLTIAVPGAVLGNLVTLGVPHASVPANGSYSAWVSAAGVVTVRYTNNDPSAALNPASGVFKVRVTL